MNIQETSLPLSTPDEVCARYLTAWAYRCTESAVYVSKSNVSFIRSKLSACGHPQVKVYSSSEFTA